MFTYCVTFRIVNKTVNGKSYDDRRQQMLAAFDEKDVGFWDEPTSFILANSSLTADSFAKRLSKGLSSTDDLLFVFEISDHSASYFGALQHEDVLESFFPLLEKAP